MNKKTEVLSTCNPHPKAPHGFDRNASHANDRYTCECESWDAYEAGRLSNKEWMKPHKDCDEGCLYVCTKGFTKFPDCVKQQRTWVGLTDEEFNEISSKHSVATIKAFVQEIELELKEKNT